MDISVIIPVYNVENYLKRCVDSILCQDGISLEIILVDDGSTDSSGKMCEEYVTSHSNITCLHISNSGPAMLQSGYKHDADIVCCNYIQVNEDGHISHTKHTDQEYVLTQDEALKAILIKDKIYSQCWTKIYKRDTMQKNGVRNTEGLKTEEDFIYNIQAFACSKTVCIVDKPLYIYTHRSKSLSKDYYRNHISQYIDNRILRLELVDNIIREQFPHLQEYSAYHCIFYYNELIGRICLFPHLYRDPRVCKVISYIRKNSDILLKHHNQLGFSNWGAYAILYVPQSLYLYYRKWK